MTDLTAYYETVKDKGSLRTLDHAHRWSTAVLKTLGFTLGGKTKKKLANALPKELGDDVKRVFWLAHFKNDQLTSHEFQNQVSRRSGNSDPQFAKIPITAVFHGVKQIVDSNVQQAVADALSPEVRELWENA
ncbi:MAG: DUF2267 domain-containing protein [Ardenticatenaceae bacterium]|nr:DUF2267 domain-containing protein [Ardenticatenaceae bacterium]MCB8946798.1 DUF2267 domain-containing protein [Ardenticatenaceae bacterium]